VQIVVAVLGGCVIVGILLAIGLTSILSNRNRPLPTVLAIPSATVNAASQPNTIAPSPSSAPTATIAVTQSVPIQQQQAQPSTVTPSSTPTSAIAGSDDLATAAGELDNTDIDGMTTPLSQNDADATTIP